VSTAPRPLAGIVSGWNAAREGASLHALVANLYPLCRSITGDGIRESLRRLSNEAPISIHEVPSGTKVFDWVVPLEWNIRDAYVRSRRGERVIDFGSHNLHVVSYSVPVHRRVPMSELREHLFTRPDQPDVIPYRTSYYHETWGFCLSQRQLDQLTDDEYEVCIDSTLEPGHLSYGECFIRGRTDREVLVSCHSCHPSLCNDNLSGMAVSARLAALLSQMDLRYSYRFLWIPGTIGAITWLALHEEGLARIAHGLVLSCLGDHGAFTYKRSRQGCAEIDRVVEYVLRRGSREPTVLDFAPTGYDERQYCSPGINLPVGCLMRTPHGQYREYHTSADNLEFVTGEALADSLLQLVHIVEALETNQRYISVNQKCEPQLGRRGLYHAIGGPNSSSLEEAMLWLLNYSDGSQTLLDIAGRSRMPLDVLAEGAGLLAAHGLVTAVE